jgi:hypothetical protein
VEGAEEKGAERLKSGRGGGKQITNDEHTSQKLGSHNTERERDEERKREDVDH